MYRDLREFLAALEAQGELVRVREPVDTYLEMSAFADRAVKSGGPALLFERPDPGRLRRQGIVDEVRASAEAGPVAPRPSAEARPAWPPLRPDPAAAAMPVVMNLFGSERRTAMALGVEDLAAAQAKVAELVELAKGPGPEGGSLLSKLSLLPKLRELAAIAPRVVRTGPVHELVEEGEDVDLARLPVITAWPADAGPFISLAYVITKDPETGERNAGIYRMQVLDGRTTGMHWQLHHGGASHFRKAQALGRRLEAVAVLGGDPAITYAASAPLPEGIDELLFAGLLRGQAVELVKARTVDLEVPAHAEIAIEGYVDPAEPPVREGPYGDHTGFYSLAEPYPAFHVTAVTRRRDAIYPTTIVGRPPMEDYFLGHASERLFLPLVRLIQNEVVDYHMPPEGVFNNLLFVAIDKRYPGQAFKVAAGLWGMGQMSLQKVIVVVDADVDVHDPKEAWWAALNHIDPERDVRFFPGPVDVLDHASRRLGFGTKMVIDGTRKLPEEGHDRPWPARIRMDPAVEREVRERWRALGLP
ncbi:MAG: menaquinone biosynthesis decarboxylase [Clostridia bacterium]|nr:menaquinone biosynthesis decarboxylase [Clostridia bacterium]